MRLGHRGPRDVLSLAGVRGEILGHDVRVDVYAVRHFFFFFRPGESDTFARRNNR
jgi:hypothetical protein